MYLYVHICECVYISCLRMHICDGGEVLENLLCACELDYESFHAYALASAINAEENIWEQMTPTSNNIGEHWSVS